MYTEKEIMNNLNAREVDFTLFGNNLRSLRDREGLTLDDVAKMLGYKTPSVVAKWETGMNKPPAEAVTKLGLIFGVPSDILLTEPITEDKDIASHIPRKPEYLTDSRGIDIKCCPCCGRPLDKNGNDGRFCKYCGQEIEGREDRGKNITSLKPQKVEMTYTRFTW